MSAYTNDLRWLIKRYGDDLDTTELYDHLRRWALDQMKRVVIRGGNGQGPVKGEGLLAITDSPRPQFVLLARSNSTVPLRVLQHDDVVVAYKSLLYDKNHRLTNRYDRDWRPVVRV